MISKMKKWRRSLRHYVIADPADNSVTLSRRLFAHIRDNAEEGEAARVFVFRIPEDGSYGFAVNPRMEQPTQWCDIQYNEKYRCIGFETLCPSVGRILYDYGLPASVKVKLSVSVRQAADMTYYQIEKPSHAQAARR